MADDVLLAENHALRARVAKLEAELQDKTFQIKILRRAATQRKPLDPRADDMFQRPHGGH